MLWTTREKKLEELHSQLDVISTFESDSDDKFLNKFFESRNKQQTKRLTRLIIEKKHDTKNLSQQIQTKQEQISETSDDIEFHQSRLNDLQVQNIKLRREVEKVLNSIKENGLEIKQTENRIEQQNKALQKLTVSLVEIANETTRQHSLYKKACLAPLDDIDYENLIQESIPPSDFEQNLDNSLGSQDLLPGSEKVDEE